MKRTQVLLELIAFDLVALKANALDLENGLNLLATRVRSHDLSSLLEKVAAINEAAIGPIEALLRREGVKLPPLESTEPTMHQVLAEAGVRAGNDTRVGLASALSIMRRAARYMEMFCSSTADSAVRLRLLDLAEMLQNWAREWIGFEIALNAAATTTPVPAASANIPGAGVAFTLTAPSFAAA